MADNINNTTRGGGGGAGMAFIIGALVVVVAVIAYFVFSGGMGAPETKKVDVDIDLPEVSAPAVPSGG
jgi:hypothetical protein